VSNYSSNMEALVLAVGTVWVLAALLLPPIRSRTLAISCLLLAVLVWTRTGISWRAYLLVWLAVHLAMTIQHMLVRGGRGRAGTAVVSAGILVWVAVAGGQQYWLPALWSALIFGALLGSHLWFRRHPGRAWVPSASSGRARRSPVFAFGTVRSEPSPLNSAAAWFPEPARDRSGENSATPEVSEPAGLTRLSSFSSFAPARRTVPEPRSSGPSLESLVPSLSAFEAERPASGPRRVLPAVLEVTPHPGRTMAVAGLAWLEPARQITVDKSMAVVDGDGNQISLKMHYRVRRVEISLEELTTGPLLEAVKRLAAGGSAADFQRQVRNALPPEAGDPGAPTRVAAPHDLRVANCQYVQVGDHNRMNIDDRFVIDRTRLPILELFAENIGLVRAFATSLREPYSGPGTAAFLRLALKAAGQVDDLDLLAQAGDPARPDTLIGHLFGITTVTGAAVVMVGVDNTLDFDVRLRRPGADLGSLRADLAALGPVVVEPPQIRATDLPDLLVGRQPRIPDPPSHSPDPQPLLHPRSPSGFGLF
jgi:hypothetical protein